MPQPHTEPRPRNTRNNVSIDNISTPVDICICTSIEDIQSATEEDPKLQMIQKYIIRGWLHMKEVVEAGMEEYWLIRNEINMIDDIAMKDKCIIIPCLLQKQILEQLLSNHMGIEKNAPTHESISLLGQHET